MFIKKFGKVEVGFGFEPSGGGGSFFCLNILGRAPGGLIFIEVSILYFTFAIGQEWED
jgi:hypothetical protein